MHLVLFLMRDLRLSCFLCVALDNRPALQLREWFAFLDPDHVTRLELVVLVVCVVVLGSANGLLVDRVGEAAVDTHDNGLVLLVADDDALESTLRHLSPLTSSWNR